MESSEFVSYLKNEIFSRKEIPAQIAEFNFSLGKNYPQNIKTCIEYIISKLFLAFEKDPQRSRFEEDFRDLLFVCTSLKWHFIYESLFLRSFVKLIEEKIKDFTARDKSEEIEERDSNNPLFLKIKHWMEVKVYLFLELFYPSSDELCVQKLNQHIESLFEISIETFIRIQSKSLFDLITDFPESIPLLIELKECASLQNSYLVIIGKELRKILNKRLLHLGASTSQILDFYVSMIKSLRLIDPSDILLNYVAIPIRNYLKLRKDTIRCIISSLTKSKDSELYDELKQGSSLIFGVMGHDYDEEAAPGESWQPSRRSKELKEEKYQDTSKGLDILATLISIYGSSELFIVEYRNLLSEKLLANITYQTESEVANLELLKIRFGDETLHSCAVMIKDLEDSKRTNASVISTLLSSVDYTIISDNYWPPFPENQMNYHDEIQGLINAYHNAYCVLKKPRKLHTIPALGVCDLELEFDDGSIRNFTVSPLQANVILFINQQQPMTFSDLLVSTESEEIELLTAIKFWLCQGIIRDISGKQEFRDQSYVTVEDQLMNPLQNSRVIASNNLIINKDDIYDDASFQNERQEKAKKFVYNQVCSLLKINNTLSAERLMVALRVFLQAALTENTNLTMKDFHFTNNLTSLRHFLQPYQDIEYLDGIYSFRPDAKK